MAKNRRKTRGDRSISTNIYFPVAKADILEKFLTNFPLPIYGSEIFICSEKWQKIKGRQEAIAPLQKIFSSF
ncbi:MAG: hypothetical protein F6K39_07885 [Okeania sp. SIO3B3]|nr:hypothetical protein [Okeania sp. SIO3B3]